MPEYDLERLSTRSFEQLVQALGTKIIGPGITVYGDGPDGKRDASFTGSVAFPSLTDPWNGTGIVQVKFKQVLEVKSKDNLDWLLARLANDFAGIQPQQKYDSQQKGIKCPDYFIIATNIRLSGNARIGGKDRLAEFMEGFKESHGLKGFAIWDGNQIARYLDAHTDIRTAYLAWILPGDVLSALLTDESLAPKEMQRALETFLACELLDDQYARLNQGGYTESKNISLASVFVDLPYINGPQTEYAINWSNDARGLSSVLLREKNDQVKCLTLFNHISNELLKPSTLNQERGKHEVGLLHPGRLVLIGGPGQGKTTLGQFVCQLHRRHLLLSASIRLSGETQSAMQLIQEMADGLPHIQAARFPFRVDLKQFASFIAAKSDTTKLIDYLFYRVSSRSGSVLSKTAFGNWLHRHPLLLVLDGLDEVPPSSNRNQIMQSIRDFISVEAVAYDLDLMVIGTTRPQGYSNEFDPSQYLHVALAPLKASDALIYGTRLAEARHPGQISRVTDLLHRLKKATENPATVRLMQSPLQVTIMLALIEGGGDPPEQRWKLFHDYYDVIYKREKERNTVYSELLSRHEPDVHWIHRRIGWLLQTRNAALGQTDAKLSHSEFDDIVEERLSQSGFDDDSERRKLVVLLRQAATDRLVLLVGNTESEIGFEIRSLQEFMAAEHIFDGLEVQVRARLRTIAPHAYWINVFLFAAGRVLFVRRELAETVLTICSELNERPDDPAQRTILTGSKLALTLLKDGTARNQPSILRVLARCASRGFNLTDLNNAVGYADVIHGVVADVLQEELDRKVAERDSRAIYSNLLLIIELADRKNKWAIRKLHNLIEKHGNQILELIDVVYSGANQMRLPKSFWVAFSNVIYHYPIAFYNSAIRRHSSELGSLVRFGPVINRNDELSAPIMSSEGCAWRIVGKQSLQNYSNIDYTFLATSSRIHDDWIVLRCFTYFARRPNLEVLLNQLRRIAELKNLSVSTLQWIAPWQFSIAFDLADQGMPWEDIILLFANRKFGDSRDWFKWEAKLRSGIDVEDFVVKSEVQIDGQGAGLILKQGSWSRSGGQTRFDMQVRAERILRSRENNNLSAIFTIFCSYDLSERWNLDGWFSVAEEYIGICREREVPLVASLISAILANRTEDIVRKKNILILLSHCRLKPYYGFSVFYENMAIIEKSFAKVWASVSSADEASRLLLVISFLPPMTLPFISEKTQLIVGSEPHAIRAAHVINLYYGKLNEEDVDGLISGWAEVQETYGENPLVHYLQYLESNRISSPSCELLLVRLLSFSAGTFSDSLLRRVEVVLTHLVEWRPVPAELRAE